MPGQVIINAEAVSWMRKQPSSMYDLVIADPPYNVGKNYGATVDSVDNRGYMKFLDEWTLEASRLLKPHGTLYAFMGFRFISSLYDILEKDRGLFFNSWICWHYTQGQGRRRGFSTRHDDIFMFTKHPKKYTFNLDDVKVPQKYYRGVNNMRGANPGDVWEFSHVHFCQKNRQAHPTQKPESLIERMVLASSHEGGNVLDPFSGSGTTLRVCQQVSRGCTGVEINPDYVKMTRERLRRPFRGFDGVDPRMKRVPLDLNDPAVRSEYTEDHKRWFLKNHESDMAGFEKEMLRQYGPFTRRKSGKSTAPKPRNADLFTK